MKKKMESVPPSSDFVKWRVCLNSLNGLVSRIMVGLALVLVTGSMGCVGYVDGGGGDVVVAGPEVGFFGGYYGRGRDVRGYSSRGAASRGFAHAGGGGHAGRR